MSFVGQKATVKVGSTSKKASCDINVSYYGSELLSNGNSVSCSIPWPKNKALNKAVTMFVVVGDVNGDLINVKVQFTLKKAKNKASSTVKTNNPKFSGSEYQLDDPARQCSTWLKLTKSLISPAATRQTCGAQRRTRSSSLTTETLILSIRYHYHCIALLVNPNTDCSSLSPDRCL